jgi:hypothetical protein
MTIGNAHGDTNTLKRAWLAAFEVEGTVVLACKVAGVGRTTAYEWRQKDESFALAWADIEEATTEAMEREAYRRAVEGTVKPMVSAGKLVTEVKEYSDTLLIFMLKSRRPERYRDNVKVEHSGNVNVEMIPVAVDRGRDVAQLLAGTRAIPTNGHDHGNGNRN